MIARNCGRKSASCMEQRIALGCFSCSLKFHDAGVYQIGISVQHYVQIRCLLHRRACSISQLDTASRNSKNLRECDEERRIFSMHCHVRYNFPSCFCAREPRRGVRFEKMEIKGGSKAKLPWSASSVCIYFMQLRSNQREQEIIYFRAPPARPNIPAASFTTFPHNVARRASLLHASCCSRVAAAVATLHPVCCFILFAALLFFTNHSPRVCAEMFDSPYP